MRAPAVLPVASLSLAFFAAVLPAQQAPLTPNQQFAHDVYKELIETNTSTMTAGTTGAAQEVAKRYRDAGFPASDVFLGGVRPDKFNRRS